MIGFYVIRHVLVQMETGVQVRRFASVKIVILTDLVTVRYTVLNDPCLTIVGVSLGARPVITTSTTIIRIVKTIEYTTDC